MDDVEEMRANLFLGEIKEIIKKGELKKYTHAGTRGKILAKELTEKSWPMVLNAIFLVSEEGLGDFVKKINEFNKELNNKDILKDEEIQKLVSHYCWAFSRDGDWQNHDHLLDEF